MAGYWQERNAGPDLWVPVDPGSMVGSLLEFANANQGEDAAPPEPTSPPSPAPAA